MIHRIIRCAVCVLCLAAVDLAARGADTNELEFIQSERQLGTFTNAVDVPVTFVLTNRSDRTVKITFSGTTCHCTTVANAPDEIRAHGTGKVELNFMPSLASGEVTQAVEIETDAKQILGAQFTANVELPVGRGHP